MPVDSKVIPLWITVAGETFHSHSQFAPSLEEVRDDPYHKHKKTMDQARTYACIWSFAIAFAAAYATNSAVPLGIWIAVTAISYYLYEYNMRKPAEEDNGESN